VGKSAITRLVLGFAYGSRTLFPACSVVMILQGEFRIGRFILQMSYGGAHTGSGANMTDWIDRRANSLDEGAKQSNLTHQVQVIHTELIDARSPAYMEKLTEAGVAIAKELHQKVGSTLGGVASKVVFGTGFLVFNEGRKRGSLSVQHNPKGRELKVNYSWKGMGIADAGKVDDETYRFIIDAKSEMYAVSSDGRKYYEPAELASAVVEKTFIDDMFK
jgi:hypothetical protein